MQTSDVLTGVADARMGLFFTFFPLQTLLPSLQAEYCLFILSPGSLESILMQFSVLPSKMGC